MLQVAKETVEAGIPSRLIAFSLPECRATLQKGASLPSSLPLPPLGSDVDVDAA